MQEIKNNLVRECGEINDSVQCCPFEFGEKASKISLNIPLKFRPVCGGWEISQRNPHAWVKYMFFSISAINFALCTLIDGPR